MEHIPKSKFRPRALEYLRQVQETRKGLIVTDRGRPVLKISPCERTPGPKAARLNRLRGTLIRYDDPFEPVGVEDWDILK